MADEFVIENAELELEVSEMVGDVSGIVKLNKTRVAELTEAYEDEHPQFPILRVEAGLSGNGNNWPDAILHNVAEQINKDEKPGYWGHIPPDRVGYDYPDPETLWLGAVVKKESGKDVLYVKGYNIPGGRARRHSKSGLARLTSWAGKASGKVVGGVRHIETFRLSSIDWARPGSQGMNAAVAGYATEMKEGEVAEVDWAKATLADIERENPSLFKLMKARVEEEMEDSISEMKKDADAGKESETIFSKLRKLLGIGDDADVVEAVTEVVSKVDAIGTGELKERVLTALTKHLKGDEPKVKATRATVMRLFPVTEMVGKDDGEIEKAVETFLAEDAEASVLVTEMVTAPAPLSRSRQNGDKSDGGKVGRSGMVSVGSSKL
jgi:hypothetical protein